MIMIIDTSRLEILTNELNEELNSNNQLTPLNKTQIYNYTKNLDINDDDFYYLLYNIDDENYYQNPCYTKEDNESVKLYGRTIPLLLITTGSFFALFILTSFFLFPIFFIIMLGVTFVFFMLIVHRRRVSNCHKDSFKDEDGNTTFLMTGENSINKKLYKEEKDDTFIQCYLNNIIKSESNNCKKKKDDEDKEYKNIEQYNQNKATFINEMKIKYDIS